MATCWSPSDKKTPSHGSKRYRDRFDKWTCEGRERPWARRIPGFSAAITAFGPKNIIWAVAHGTNRDLDRPAVQRRDRRRAAPPLRASLEQKMGIHEWSYDNISRSTAYKVPHLPNEVG